MITSTYADIDIDGTYTETDVLRTLQRASWVVDRMWSAALEADTEQAAFRLGEASLGLHRALLALDGGVGR